MNQDSPDDLQHELAFCIEHSTRVRGLLVFALDILDDTTVTPEKLRFAADAVRLADPHNNKLFSMLQRRSSVRHQLGSAVEARQEVLEWRKECEKEEQERFKYAEKTEPEEQTSAITELEYSYCRMIRFAFECRQRLLIERGSNGPDELLAMLAHEAEETERRIFGSSGIQPARLFPE
jgi:hypothetical protein